MYFTSYSLAYVFLAMSLIAAVFFLYFKSLVIKTSENNKAKDAVIGNMKNPEQWRQNNSTLGNLSLFWSILSLIVFIYLKFFYRAGLVNIIYPLIYFSLEVITIIFFGAARSKRRAS